MVDVNSREHVFSDTPLSIAVRLRHEEIAWKLLEHQNVNVTSRDINGQTPLSLAAENGHDGIFKVLLYRSNAVYVDGHVNVNSMDWCGHTPLAWAAGKGHEAVVRALLDVPNVNKTPVDSSGWTLLSLSLSL